MIIHPGKIIIGLCYCNITTLTVMFLIASCENVVFTLFFKYFVVVYGLYGYEQYLETVGSQKPKTQKYG